MPLVPQIPQATAPILRILTHCGGLSAAAACSVVKCHRMLDVIKRILDAPEPSGAADVLAAAHHAARLHVSLRISACVPATCTDYLPLLH